MKFNYTEDLLVNKNRAMNETENLWISVDMHCHSSYSDGAVSPVQIAKNLYESGIKFAALTDHNTIAGLPLFSQTLTKYDIGYVSGLEITTQHHDDALHILAYGFDTDNTDLIALLDNKTSSPAFEYNTLKVYSTSSEIIELIHRAGGIAVLAHPLQTQPDFDKLLMLIDELKNMGLDGIEALYGPNTSVQNENLLKVAQEYNLIVSAGTDYHDVNDTLGMVIDMKYWKTFRDALLKAPFIKKPHARTKPLKKKKNRWFSFARNIFLPAFLSLVLFTAALFEFFLPYFDETLMNRKREEIRQLTQVAYGVLSEAVEEVQSGAMTLEQAQTLAKSRISAMRYGINNKDYFWIQDTTPHILMHPYRTDLNNQNVSEFKDEQGTRIFVEFSELALKEGEGYVSYVWQWMDEPDRVEAKESYIRYFEPWGWIIGTGIYTSDVQAEIANLQHYIIIISAAVIGVVLLLLIYLIRQGVLLEKSRIEAKKLLIESTQRYKALSEAATEGALFVSGERCRYANTVMYEMLGCTSNRIDLLYLNDVFPDVKENEEWISYVSKGIASDRTVGGVIRRCNGDLLSCDLTVKKMQSESGLMILVRRTGDRSSHTGTQAALNRLLHIPDNIISDITDSIINANRAIEVAALCKKTSGIVQSLLENGTSSIIIARMISTITDLATQRFIELTINDIGAPPMPFAFLALGSQGRQAQTLFSDQDNALIYKMTDKQDEISVQEYFLKLSAIVCDHLEFAGYAKCTGGMNASNPKWCQPLPKWKSYYAKWIRQPEPQKIVDFCTLFDFRAVSGDSALASELKEYICSEINNDKRFLIQVAENAVSFRTPQRFFGNIMASGGIGIDVKKPAIAIVSFVRLYSIKNGIKETNTLLALDKIKSLGVISDARHRDTVTAYEILLRLRLWNQILKIKNNEQLDNYIEQGQLGNIEEVLLKESFKEIDALQGVIERDFLRLV